MMKSDQRSTIAAGLREGAWFGALPLELQDEILDRSEVRSFSAGQMISAQDSPPIGLFGLIDGQVSFEHWASEEESVLLHIASAGMWFGELAVLMNAPTAVAITAHIDLRVLLLPHEEFRRLVGEEPRYYPYFARLALERYALFLRLFAQVQGLSPVERLRTRLADMADLRRTEQNAAKVVEIELTQAELAEMVGVSRQTVNELLRRVADEGLIEYSFRKIRILDSARLRGGLPATGIGPGPWPATEAS